VIYIEVTCSTASCNEQRAATLVSRRAMDRHLDNMQRAGWILSVEPILCPACLETRELLAMEARR
jgi:hypothetical protein